MAALREDPATLLQSLTIRGDFYPKNSSQAAINLKIPPHVRHLGAVFVRGN